MTPQEIQEIKDKAAKEFGFEDWNQYADRMLLEMSDILVIDHAIGLASKREIRIPSINEARVFYREYEEAGGNKIFTEKGSFVNGFEWTIERVNELNK